MSPALRVLCFVVPCAVLSAISPLPAVADDRVIDEVKLGGLAHDVGFLTHHVETGPNVNLEVLFTSPDILKIIGSPRLHVGGDINTNGMTSNGYFGLTWSATLVQGVVNPNDGIFISGSFGGAIQDGYIDTAPPGRKRLGSRILFRESAELGYQITPVISVSAMLDHMSNADLGRHNAGITSVGGRIGFKF